MIVSPEPATRVVAADYQSASEKASDGEEPFPEPLAECSEHLGWRCPWLLDGRDAPSAESDAEGDDPTACNANWKEAVV
jgi:hypothetical protein